MNTLYNTNIKRKRKPFDFRGNSCKNKVKIMVSLHLKNHNQNFFLTR